MAMFSCPSEEDVVLHECDGMMFRTPRALMCGDGYRFEEENTGQPEITVCVPFPTGLAAKVMGPKKANILMLRKQTKVKITARTSETTGEVVVVGDTQEKVDAATERVRQFIDTICNEQPFTHFVAIPCVGDTRFVNAGNGVRGFVDRVGSLCRLSDDAWDNLSRLHLTLMTVRLNEADCPRVQKLIEEAVSEFNWTGPARLDMTGVGILTGADESGPRVFYARPRSSETKEMIEQLRDAIAEKLRGAKVEVIEVVNRLHVTILRR